MATGRVDILLQIRENLSGITTMQREALEASRTLAIVQQEMIGMRKETMRMAQAQAELARKTAEATRTQAEQARQQQSLRSSLARGAAMAAGAVGFVGVAQSIRGTAGAMGDFEAAVIRAGAAAGANAEQVAAMSTLARDMGRTTRYSAIEAAEGMEMLAKNGLRVEQVLGGAAEASIRLATATGSDLSAAADVATDVMANFRKTAAELGGVVDGVVGVTLASKFHFDDYRLALGQAGGVAGGLGITLEDFNAAIAMTASTFASGSDAGTSFKSFLQRLVPQSAQAKAVMQSLGLEFFDTQGRIKSMALVAEELRTKLAGLSIEARSRALTEIFGMDAVRTAIAFAERGAEGIERFQAAIAGTTAAEQAEARMQGFNAALKLLRNTAVELAIELGESGVLGAATAVLKLLGNPAVLRTAVLMVGGLASAWAAYKVGVVAATAASVVLRGQLTLLSLWASANPVGLALAGIAALAFAGYGAFVQFFQKPREEAERLNRQLAETERRLKGVASETAAGRISSITTPEGLASERTDSATRLAELRTAVANGRETVGRLQAEIALLEGRNRNYVPGRDTPEELRARNTRLIELQDTLRLAQDFVANREAFLAAEEKLNARLTQEGEAIMAQNAERERGLRQQQEASELIVEMTGQADALAEAARQHAYATATAAEKLRLLAADEERIRDSAAARRLTADSIADATQRQQVLGLIDLAMENELAEVAKRRAELTKEETKAALDVVRAKIEQLELTARILEHERSLVTADPSLDPLVRQRRLNDLVDRQRRILGDILALQTEAARQFPDSNFSAAAQGTRERIDTLGAGQRRGQTPFDAARERFAAAQVEGGQFGAQESTIRGITAALMDYVAEVQNLERAWAQATDTILRGMEDGIRTSLVGLIEGTMSWRDAWNNLASTILGAVINAFAQMVAQYIVSRLAMFVIDQTLGTTATQTASVQAIQLAAAWAPAATAAATASYGAAAAIGLGSVIGAMAAGTTAAIALAGAGAGAGLAGFATGGVITGPGSGTSDSVLIRASAGEGVLPAWVMDSIGTSAFEHVRRTGELPVMAADASSPSRGAAGAAGGSGGGETAVAIFDKRNSAAAWLGSRGGRRQLAELNRRNRHTQG